MNSFLRLVGMHDRIDHFDYKAGYMTKTDIHHRFHRIHNPDPSTTKGKDSKWVIGWDWLVQHYILPVRS